MDNNKTKTILEQIDEWLELINVYKFWDEIKDITGKIVRLKSVLANGKGDDIASVTKTIYDNTDFEEIEIKFIKLGRKNYVTIRKDAIYLIDRLSLLGFKKIAEHELEKNLELLGIETRIVYKELKLALEKKKRH